MIKFIKSLFIKRKPVGYTRLYLSYKKAQHDSRNAAAWLVLCGQRVEMSASAGVREFYAAQLSPAEIALNKALENEQVAANKLENYGKDGV